MGKKIGRNDPCPCGSGKKYKKCCGLEREEGGIRNPEGWFPESERTGTLWDEYMELIPGVMMYGKKILQFDKDGKDLKKAVDKFEKRFRPGEEGGISDSFFMSWMYFDLRFGRTRETVGERFLADPIIAELHEPGPTYLRHLCESYLTFYEVVGTSGAFDTAEIEELATGKRFTLLHVRELFEFEPVVGEIWYLRRVGLPDSSISYTTPYVFGPEAARDFRRLISHLEEEFLSEPWAAAVPEERRFAESQKEAATSWAEYLLEGWRQEQAKDWRRDAGFGKESGLGDMSILVNSDGEELILVEMHFRIRDEEAVRKKLDALRSFPNDEEAGSWTWLKAKSRKFPDKPRTVLGHLRIEGDRLIAETNSRERAARLKHKIRMHLEGFVAYEKTLYREPDDIPELSPEEIEERRKKQDELKALPEIQAVIKKQLEHHYFEDWPATKLPALGGRTPIQAVKDEEGRRKVMKLIDDVDRMQDRPQSDMPRIDFDRLRRKLGLSPKAN